MKVVLPTNTTHDIILIPRYVPTGAITLTLYNESTQISTDVANNYSITKGFLKISFNFSFTDKDKYQIKIKEGSEVVFRDKLIATSQETQEYKQTNGLYTY